MALEELLVDTPQSLTEAPASSFQAPSTGPDTNRLRNPQCQVQSLAHGTGSTACLRGDPEQISGCSFVLYFFNKFSEVAHFITEQLEKLKLKVHGSRIAEAWLGEF